MEGRRGVGRKEKSLIIFLFLFSVRYFPAQGVQPALRGGAGGEGEVGSFLLSRRRMDAGTGAAVCCV